MKQFDKNEVIIEGEIQLFRALWQESFDSIFIVKREASGEYIIERTNRAQEKTFQLQPNQLAGCRLADILAPEVLNRIVARYDDCLDKNHPISYEETYQIDESGSRYWNTLILPVIDPQTGLERIFGISREITQAKLAEEVLKEANEKLEAEVVKRTKQLTDALAEMEAISVIDKLTGLYNRHRLDEVLLSEHTLAERYASTFGVMLLDLDNFKVINDKFGHHQGDCVLKAIGKILKSRSRKTDTAGRWGGDEFLIITPFATEASLTEFAKQLKNEIEDYDFGCSTQVTASFGGATFQTGDTVNSLISRADKALYDSKKQGRNAIAHR